MVRRYRVQPAAHPDANTDEALARARLSQDAMLPRGLSRRASSRFAPLSAAQREMAIRQQLQDFVDGYGGTPRQVRARPPAPDMVAVQRAVENAEAREIREQQDLEFAKALEADRLEQLRREEDRHREEQEKQEQERLREEKLARTRARNEQQSRLRRLRVAALDSLPPPPSPDLRASATSGNVSEIVCRLPDGTRIGRRWSTAETKIEDIYTFVAGHHPKLSSTFHLTHSFPKKTLLPERSQTLGDAGLKGRVLLCVEEEMSDNESDASDIEEKDAV
eukprot:CAMPEP_0174248016 /NCGR_PEP_ID=MMETSP0417-20130205/42865_1 /TAXON_ID=242541 /ORGANISM="Mayorella sp, Strain BSH-02190019" /LENGTH=277 /DNA_ID=CAMNT_0015327877 /DNA_START=982 /DNA_END=1811 /DNA_ORIENTATION=-